MDRERDLDAGHRARLEAGRAAWPALVVQEADFIGYMSALAEGGELPPIERAGDLWLVCACMRGVPGAATALEGVCRGVVVRAVARIDRALVDDAVQSVLMKLLVAANGEQPAIGTFRGQVPLTAWLRTIAVRHALNMRRRIDDKPHDSLSGVVTSATSTEPAVEIARQRYGPEVDRALVGALGALGVRERVLLRLHHGEGWPIDRVAAHYHVGRSTAQRWIAAARKALLEAAKESLKGRLGVTPTELESILVIVQSELHVSLLRLLDGAPDDTT